MNDFPDIRHVKDPDNMNQRNVIPFVINDKHSPKYKEKIMNSEVKYECWFIENPVSRELTKRITLKLGAKAQ